VSMVLDKLTLFGSLILTSILSKEKILKSMNLCLHLLIIKRWEQLTEFS